MPEQYDAAKRREKQLKSKLKTQHVMSKSINNKQYITVEGKDLHVIESEQTVVYDNPRDLKLTRQFQQTESTSKSPSALLATIHQRFHKSSHQRMQSVQPPSSREIDKKTISMSSLDIKNYNLNTSKNRQINTTNQTTQLNKPLNKVEE